MKKILTLSVVAAMFAVTSCGPSADDLAATEKAKQDSIAMADSMAAVTAAAAEQAAADSIAAAALATAEKAKQDSVAHADSVAKKLIKK